CMKRADIAYRDANIDLLERVNSARDVARHVELDIDDTACRWTPEQIEQFVATIVQAASQLEQGAAQIISAAKSKNAGTTAAQQPTAPQGSTDKNTVSR